jgi:hypothetical protein
MSVQLPPELMAPEERGARAAELEREIGREWIRFLITDLGLITIPFIVLAVVSTATDSVTPTWLIVVPSVVFVLWAAHAAYWILVRIRPRREELERLRGGES